MTRRNLRLSIPTAVVLLLVWGIVRAAGSREALQTRCRDEQERLGFAFGLKTEEVRKRLTRGGELFAKYPTPEITLCRSARVVPEGTAEIVVKGKFAPGTKFLLADNVKVIKEAMTATEYRATVKAAPGLGPSYEDVEAFAPVSCATNGCRALYIGGKYEWEFTADNGWRIKLKLVNEGFTGKEKGFIFAGQSDEEVWEPHNHYRAEFYQGSSAKPFAVTDVDLQLPSASSEDAEYRATPAETEGDVKGGGERKEGGPGCNDFRFQRTSKGVEGEVGCGEAKTISIKGTMKYLGP